MYHYDHESFFRYFRMAPSQFDYILSTIAPFISKDITGHSPISPMARLVIMNHDQVGCRHFFVILLVTQILLTSCN